MLQIASRQSREKLTKFIQEKGSVIEESHGKKRFAIKVEDVPVFEKLEREAAKTSAALETVPTTFVVSLVSQYDAYLGRLLRVAFLAKPDLLNASQRQISFSDLVKFDSFDEAKEHTIEKEVESVIRGSHSEQFSWMENRFGLPLRKELPNWPTFIELTERRNLFVHCDGVVSSQYLSVCRDHFALPKDPPKIGSQLKVPDKYFQNAFSCIYEIGVKLGHVLWRKLKPEELKIADESLNLACFDLLSERQYELSKILLKFSSETLKKHASEDLRRISRINLAIAHKWSNEDQICRSILEQEDWTACSDKFHLAVAVLKNDYKGAGKIMRRIGKNGEVARHSYVSWPLFKEFRKSTEFLDAYREIFESDFAPTSDEQIENKVKTTGDSSETKTN